MQVQEILDANRASLAMDGLYVTKEDEKNARDVLSGKRSLEEVISEIEQKYMKQEQIEW